MKYLKIGRGMAVSSTHEPPVNLRGGGRCSQIYAWVPMVPEGELVYTPRVCSAASVWSAGLKRKPWVIYTQEQVREIRGRKCQYSFPHDTIH